MCTCCQLPSVCWEQNENTDLLCRLTSYKNLLCDTKNRFKWFVIFLVGIQPAVPPCIPPSLACGALIVEMTSEMAHYVLVVCMCTHIFAETRNVLFIHILLWKLMLKYFIAERCEIVGKHSEKYLENFISISFSCLQILPAFSFAEKKSCLHYAFSWKNSVY